MAKGKPVEMGKKLRDAHEWFEKGAGKPKEVALEKKRVELRANGPKLTGAELQRVADELEQIQRQLNDLGTRHDELSERLLAHWAHLGVEELEIEGGLGKTLIGSSFKLSVDPDLLAKILTEAQWRTVTERRLNPSLLLVLAERESELRAAVVRAARASVSIKITPPSSRRPKSGQPEDEE